MRKFLEKSEKSIEQYGMQFIRHCNPRTLVLTYEDRDEFPPDTDELRAAMGMNRKRTSNPLPRQPSLLELREALNARPESFMRPLDFTNPFLLSVLESRDESDMLACSLFVQFTSTFKLAAIVTNYLAAAEAIRNIRDTLLF